jgi:hypothetical protein
VIERILLSGQQEAGAFLYEAYSFVNICAARGDTYLCTVVPGRYDDVVKLATKCNVTLQRRRGDVPDGSPADDYWELVHQGKARAWSA